MNISINSRFVSLLWWFLAPLLSAVLINLAVSIYFAKDNFREFHFGFLHRVYVRNIPKFTVFNQMIQKITTPKKETLQDLSGLKLKACYIGKNSKFIVIEDKGKSIFLNLNEMYKNAKLEEIGVDYALFVRGGVRLKLSLAKIEPNRSSRITNKGIVQASPLLNSRFVDVKRNEFKRYTKDMNQALRDVRFQLLRKSKKFIGIKMSFIRKGSLFDKMGLKKGDIIKSIDGTRLNSIMDLLPYYNRLNDTTTIQIGFERDKKMKEITYEIN